MELEGISNACRLNVMIKRPTISTAAMEAVNSSLVSFFFGSCSRSFSGFAFFALKVFTLINPLVLECRVSMNDAQGALPAHRSSQIFQVGDQTRQFITDTRLLRFGDRMRNSMRKIDDQRAANDIFAGDKSPIAAVRAVVAVVA